MFSLFLYTAADGSGKTALEECGLLGCTAMRFGESLLLLVSYSDREDERYMFLRNVGLSPNYTASESRRACPS
jgi:hypothetical protein